MADDCNGEAVTLSNLPLRIGSIFIILVAALLGAIAPIILARQGRLPVPKSAFFACKFVGSGVIIATAWMHLLVPAVENLQDPCLASRLGEYPWAFFIALMTVMLIFFAELLALNVGRGAGHCDMDEEADPSLEVLSVKKQGPSSESRQTEASEQQNSTNSSENNSEKQRHPRHLADQLTAIFILEFGVVFHSVFIGLTLGTTEDLNILLVVLTFHQLFEGLGLGSRLALTPWQEGKRWLAFLLAAGYALSTPIGIAAGIGAEPNNANTQKLVNGIFDAISAGILMYTGLVELLAREFMFSPHMRAASLKIQLLAFACVLFGVGIMALLATWA